MVIWLLVRYFGFGRNKLAFLHSFWIMDDFTNAIAIALANAISETFFNNKTKHIGSHSLPIKNEFFKAVNYSK